MPNYLTISEAARLLKLSERTVYDLCRQGRLAGAAKVGGQWRLDEDKLIAWMAGGGERTADEQGTKDKR